MLLMLLTASLIFVYADTLIFSKATEFSCALPILKETS